MLLTAAPAGGDDKWGLLSGHNGLCSCPICTGEGLDNIPAIHLAEIGVASAAIGANGAAQAPLSALPQLHSNATTTAKLFLDFNSHFESSWGLFGSANTPVFDQDGDLTTFSDGELSSIQQIWARVAEDFAPFNIDVTTVDPGNQANGVVAVIAIGGSYLDWYGSSSGGVAYIGGFYSDAPNVGYVFENNMGSNAKNIAEAASHEAGHLFGLQHQAKWSGATLLEAYSTGTGYWAPLMGVGYSATRSTWHNGTTGSAPTDYQDDLAIISGSSNGFGYRIDDYGGTTTTASNLPVSGTSVNFSGLIGRSNDLDVWSFATTGGTVTFQLAGTQYGSNLDAVVELWNSSGSVIMSNAPSNSQGASLTAPVGAGTYYLVARSVGDYGDMGQYTITGSLPAPTTSPEISLTVSGADVADGGTLSFGTTSPGVAVTRTVTVTNQGNDVLNVSALNAGMLPAGFSIVSNLGATSLTAGASTTLVLRLDAGVAGTYGGSIQLLSNDGDESPYDLVLGGNVTAPEIAITIGGPDLTDGQTVDFGSTSLGQSVSRTFTVTNAGTATLALTSLNSAILPAGFTLIANLGSTSLTAGQSTTFTIRLDASAVGTYGGSIQLLSNDGDESPYDLVLGGTVAAPEIAITIGGSGLTDGQTVDFGSTSLGQSVSRTFTVTNAGTATLALTSLNSAILPAGFTLIANLGSTSLAAGQSTTFTIRFDASAAGSYGGTIQLVNNDSDENPFDLTVNGIVSAAQVQIINDLGPAFTTLGQWSAFPGQGYQKDIHYAAAGTGSNVARWTANVPPGVYQVAVTWSSAPNRATNAPFTVLDGATRLGTTAVNQQVAPADFTDQGVGWKTLGTFTITASSLVVELSNNANQFVIADAVRLQRVSSAPPPPLPAPIQIINDLGPTFTTLGQWSAFPGQGYQKDIHYAAAGTGSNVARWTANVTPGVYQVAVTWSSATNRATNAPFTVLDGATRLGTTAVNQQLAPADFTDQSVGWKTLGTFTITASSLVVELSNNANQFVIADAVRIQRVESGSIAASLGNGPLGGENAAIRYRSPAPQMPYQAGAYAIDPTRAMEDFFAAFSSATEQRVGSAKSGAAWQPLANSGAPMSARFDMGRLLDGNPIPEGRGRAWTEQSVDPRDVDGFWQSLLREMHRDWF